jgi:hypothetical protein
MELSNIKVSELTKADFADPNRRSLILQHIADLKAELKGFARFKATMQYYKHQPIKQSKGREYFQRPEVKAKRRMQSNANMIARYEEKLQVALEKLAAKPNSKVAKDRVQWVQDKLSELKQKHEPLPPPQDSHVESFC